ncbi:MAG: DUF4275 family protein [Clostridia bacterium]|nr:DUF4275 family protein [Clostridia bacterium]
MDENILSYITDSNKLKDKWLSVFGKNVSKKMIEAHVTYGGNLLWHLFTWCKVPCLKGDEARTAFNNLKYTEAIKFYEHRNRLEKITMTGKISAEELDNETGIDIYIVAKDFSWTYVRTHECDWCGPYFCKP